jgi:putative ABC transport system permease protein
MDEAIAQTRHILRTQRGVKPGEPDNFDFYNSASLITQFNKMSLGVKLAGFVIGIIALIVAGIGIMNIMLVAVTERTREIGLRMAVGAKPWHVLSQFLVEATSLSMAGGLIGTGLGLLAARLVATRFHWPFTPRLDMAVIAFGFSAIVGIAFGLYPARKASKLDPIEALRYE